jgi:putative PEP-CTERM system histidine kinase
MAGSAVLQGGLAGHVAAAGAYFALAVLVLWWRHRTFSGLLLSGASLITALWAGATAYALYRGTDILGLSRALEIARSCSWMLVLLGLLYWMPPSRRSAIAIGIVGFGLAMVALTLVLDSERTADSDLRSTMVIAGHLALALFGLALIENLFRNSPQERYWSIKHLCLGAGALFAYDFFLYSDALLFRHIELNLYLARGVTSAIVIPLFAIYAVRNREAGPQLAISRRLAFHSATLIGAGLYLITMAAAGYYVRRFGGSWTSFLQAIFFFGAIVLILIPILSGSFRAYTKVLVEKSLFAYKYDYRAEWLRFTETISSSRPELTLPVRVIEAVCNILESPDGALWLQRGSGKFVLAASWNASRWHLDELAHTIPAHASLARFLERSQWIVSFDEFAASPLRYQGLSELPEWMRGISRGWLIIPLIHNERLYGIMMLGRPRAERALAWEDYDILKTVGREAASYLVLQQTHEALAEARQFEDFNKRFAFVVHDIKNLASQLSLITSNAARHRDNTDFQRDALETVKQSVDKLNRLLRQLHREPSGVRSQNAVALAPLLREIVAARCSDAAGISLNLEADGLAVSADQERLKTAVDHLVQNAVDAVGADGTVEVRLRGSGAMAVVEVVDNGPGMDPEFARDRLFRPFASTKEAGYGIGAYESREYARSLGGSLDVVTAPGRGTIMRMSLPTVTSV